jgi:serine/threonine protein kinase
MKDKGVLSEEEALMILRQLACGFQELQRNKIIHRDLKPANIFSNAGEFKIGDLGFARVLEKTTDLTKTMLGSLCYMAPEILRNRKYGFPVDVWSLGVVLHQMVIGKRPFGNPFIGDFDSMFECIEKTKLAFEDSKISEEMQELIQAMLTIDP